MAMRIIQVTLEYSFGDIVYLKTDPNALPRIVIGWLLTPGTLVSYMVKVGEGDETYHYGLELTTEPTEVEALFKDMH
jgi:hypothetical protein